MAHYRLATTLGQFESSLALPHLRKAEELGLWQYIMVNEDDELEPIRDHPEVIEILERIKKRYEIAASDAGKAVIVAPRGEQPDSGYPVLVWLSGYRTSGIDDAEENSEDLLQNLPVIYIGINGTEKLDYDQFRWSYEEVQSTQDAVRNALDLAAEQYDIDRKKVILMGFSLGALHSAQLLAHYPDDYSGALIVSPGGGPRELPPHIPEGKRIVLTYGEGERQGNIELAQKLYDYFSENNDVQMFTHDGGHFFDENWQALYPGYLESILK